MSTVSTDSPARAQAPVAQAAPWEALGPPAHAPVRAALAEKLFRHATRELPVRIAMAGGERLGRGGDGTPLMRIERPAAFFHRLGADGKVGFGEAYMAGDWTSPEPAELLTPFAARVSNLVPRPLQGLRRWVDASQPESERNTRSGARRNIQRHYDLSNDVFATFLDKTMTYSGAWFAPGESDLAAAQHRKLDNMLDRAGVGVGTRLLEIGTGWGSLATRAAQRGARVTTLTLSQQQARFAREQIVRAGLEHLVDVRLCDYRMAEGRYDAVITIEMVEAVGAEYWSTYFRTLDRLLLPGGTLALQAITMPHERMLATRNSYTWVHKYIFPGGMLPSTVALEQQVRAHTDLRLAERHSFGVSYGETLRQWRQRFNAGWQQITALGFSERFRRMWEFYLAYSEAGFRAGYLDVWQFGFRKSGASGRG